MRLRIFFFVSAIALAGCGTTTVFDDWSCDTPTGPCDLGGFDGFRTIVQSTLISSDPQTLDATLTNEQRALLGCGPFYASRCDTSLRATPGTPVVPSEVIGSGGNDPGANRNGETTCTMMAMQKGC